MEYYPLTLLAIYSAAALLQLRVSLLASAQSGELRPGSGSGAEEDARTYNRLINEMTRNINETIVSVARPGEGGSGAGAPLSPGQDFCELYSHHVRLEFQGCVGEYPTFSCTGRCRSEQRPSIYNRRQDARVDPFITTCRCCSTTDWGVIAFHMDLACSDNTTITVRHVSVFARRCGCSACY